MQLDPHHTAIIAVHLQHRVITPDGAFGASYVQQPAAAPLVYTRVALQPGYSDRVGNLPPLAVVAQQGCLVDATPAASIVEKLTSANFVVTYQPVSGLVGRQLENVPRGRGVDTVTFTGVATDMSMESTAQSPEDIRYCSSGVSDACIAPVPEAVHQASPDSLGELATRAAVLGALKDAGVSA